MQIFHVLKVDGGGEQAVGRVAAAQRGLVQRRQLHAAGLGRDAIARLVKRGWLHPVLPRVYAVGHPSLMPLARELAVLLHVGHDSIISHLSAAAIWGMAAHPAERVQVTVVGRGMRPRPGMDAHRVADLDRRDVRLRDGLPVTSPARTMIDVAGSADIETAQRALSELRVRGLARDPELESAIERSPTRKGVAQLRSILADEHGPAMTRSEAERRLLGLIKLAELPVPSCNVALHGFEVDALWREPRLVVEVDGHRFHGPRAAFERDRRRDQRLAAAGFRVIRVTWRQLQTEPLAVVARLAQALSVTGAGG